MTTFANRMLLIAVAALTVGAASAQSAHFLSGPSCTDIGTQLQCTGTIAGLGNATGQATVTLNGVIATTTTECTSPGGNVAPGQTKVSTVSATGTFPIDRNGRVTFTLTTAEPTPGSCPNPRWTAGVAEVTFDTSNISFTVNGQPVRP
jgi:hypothetical protein